MELTAIITEIPTTTLLVAILTFLGAASGEYYREMNDNITMSVPKFLSRFLASWVIGFASTFFVQSVINTNNVYMLMATSVAMGFIGHEKSIKYIYSILSSMIKGKVEGQDETDE